MALAPIKFRTVFKVLCGERNINRSRILIWSYIDNFFHIFIWFFFFLLKTHMYFGGIRPKKKKGIRIRPFQVSIFFSSQFSVLFLLYMSVWINITMSLRFIWLDIPFYLYICSALPSCFVGFWFRFRFWFRFLFAFGFWLFDIYAFLAFFSFLFQFFFILFFLCWLLGSRIVALFPSFVGILKIHTNVKRKSSRQS